MKSGQVNRLEQVEVQGLFSKSDLTVELDPSCTVLTGGNGTGKSTLLRLIWAVASGQQHYLRQAPLRSLRLQFSRLPDFVMTREDDGTFIRWGSASAQLRNPTILQDLPDWVREILVEADYDGDVAVDILMEAALPRGVSPSQLIEIRRTLSDVTPSDVELDQLPDEIRNLQQAFHAAFVTDQRLLIEEAKVSPRERRLYGRPRVGRIPRAVEALSSDIATRISRADMQYARASQRIDRELPKRILAQLSSGGQESADDVKALSAVVEGKRERMRQIGLVDRDSTVGDLDLEDYSTEALRTVVAAVLRSTEEKLAELDDLADRLTAFKHFLDSMFLGKSAVLSREGGLAFRVGGLNIPPRSLSSGEQQMVVLAHQILFESSPGTIVIIDEPEISLHIAWQDRLLSDLIDMGSRSNLQFVMATHSPMILSGHPEMERSLDGLAR